MNAQPTLRQMIAEGRLAPLMDSEVPLVEAAAHAWMKSTGHVRKIVLKVE